MAADILAKQAQLAVSAREPRRMGCPGQLTQGLTVTDLAQCQLNCLRQEQLAGSYDGDRPNRIGQPLYAAKSTARPALKGSRSRALLHTTRRKPHVHQIAFGFLLNRHTEDIGVSSDAFGQCEPDGQLFQIRRARHQDRVWTPVKGQSDGGFSRRRARNLDIVRPRSPLMS